tara:strand:- start:12487 stop:12879 length:393 start_codon:yes stop_codon:yes gene_type:complete
MELNDLSKIASDQEAGHEFELLDPVQSDPTGIKLTIAGPDSEIARNARFEMEREIARLSKRKDGLTPEARDGLMNDYFCTVTLGWNVTEAGEPVPFSKPNLLRLIKAGAWVRGQIDLFAADRSPYFGRGE